MPSFAISTFSPTEATNTAIKITDLPAVKLQATDDTYSGLLELPAHGLGALPSPLINNHPKLTAVVLRALENNCSELPKQPSHGLEPVPSPLVKPVPDAGNAGSKKDGSSAETALISPQPSASSSYQDCVASSEAPKASTQDTPSYNPSPEPSYPLDLQDWTDYEQVMDAIGAWKNPEPTESPRHGRDHDGRSVSDHPTGFGVHEEYRIFTAKEKYKLYEACTFIHHSFDPWPVPVPDDRPSSLHKNNHEAEWYAMRDAGQLTPLGDWSTVLEDTSPKAGSETEEENGSEEYYVNCEEGYISGEDHYGTSSDDGNKVDHGALTPISCEQDDDWIDEREAAEEMFNEWLNMNDADITVTVPHYENDYATPNSH